MIHILLTILKVLGIILLIILGILLSLICLVLFVPIRYKGKIIYKDNHFYSDIRVSYLLKLVRLRCLIGKDEGFTPDISFKILFFNLSRKNKKDNKSATNKKDKEQEDKKSVHETVKSIDVKESATTKDDFKQVDISEESELQITQIDLAENGFANSDPMSNKPIEENKSVFAKISAMMSKVLKAISKVFETISKVILKVFETISKVILKVFETISKIFDIKKRILNKFNSSVESLRKINKKKKRILKFLRHEDTKLAIKKLKKQTARLLKKILPYSVKGNIIIGMSEPDSTGKILGYVSIFKGGYLKKLNIKGDFDNQIVDVDVVFKGHIFGITLLAYAIRLYFNKKLKQFISMLKK